MTKEYSLPVELALALLALISVTLLGIELTQPLEASQKNMMDIADLGISIFFLSEWSYRLYHASSKKKFFARTWWELLASLPFDMFQALRPLRVLRVLRIFRLMAKVRDLFSGANKFMHETSVIYVAIVTSCITFASTLLFYHFEKGVNKNVSGVWDSFYWAFVTVTTVGYGDISPVTVGGRLTMMFLTLTGIGTLGVLTAEITSWAVRTEGKK